MAESLRVYRTLLRAIHHTFGEDAMALSTARMECRKVFEGFRNISDSTDIKSRIKDGYEAANFIRNEIVQGKMNERGNYEAKVDQAHVGQVMDFKSPDEMLKAEQKKPETKA